MMPKPVTAHSITSSARARGDCAPEPLLVPRGEGRAHFRSAPRIVRGIYRRRDDLHDSVLLLRRDLPGVGTSLGRLRCREPRRSEPCNDFVDMTAAVADYKHDLDASVGRRGTRHVQVEHVAACAVGINRVGAGFLPFWREIGLACRPKAVAPVITLRKSALPVIIPNPRRNRWWAIRQARRSVGGNAEGVFALKRRVRATVIVLRPDRTAQHR